MTDSQAPPDSVGQPETSTTVPPVRQTTDDIMQQQPVPNEITTSISETTNHDVVMTDSQAPPDSVGQPETSTTVPPVRQTTDDIMQQQPVPNEITTSTSETSNHDVAMIQSRPQVASVPNETALVKVKEEDVKFEAEDKKPHLIRRSVTSKYGLTALKMRDEHYAKVKRDKDSRAATVRKDAVAGTAVRHVEKADRVPCNDPISCISIAEVPLGNKNTATRVAWLDTCLVCGTGEAVPHTFGGDLDDTTVRSRYIGPAGGEFLSCVDCGECMHAFCTSTPIATMTSEARRTWRCPNCKLCELCGLCKQEDESCLVYCDVCDKGYHLDCIQPPLAMAPPSRWICGLCVECRYCDRLENKESMNEALVIESSDRRTWSSRCDTCFDCLKKSLSRSVPSAVERAPLQGRCAALTSCLCLDQEGSDKPLVELEKVSMCPYCGARFHIACGDIFLQPVETACGQPEHRACTRCIAASGIPCGIETHIGNDEASWRCTVATAQIQRQRRKRRLRQQKLDLAGSTALVHVDGDDSDDQILPRPFLRGWTAFFADRAAQNPSMADDCRTLCRAIELALGGAWKDPRQCALCKKSGDCPAAGRLVSVKDEHANWVHANCARWSSEVYEIEGGWALNVYKAIQRSKTLKCSWCKVTGATMGCCETTCRTNYHFRCGGHNGALAIDGGRVICSMCRRRYNYDMLRIEQLDPILSTDMIIEELPPTNDQGISTALPDQAEPSVEDEKSQKDESIMVNTAPLAQVDGDVVMSTTASAVEGSEILNSCEMVVKTDSSLDAEEDGNNIKTDDTEYIHSQPLKIKVKIPFMRALRFAGSSNSEANIDKHHTTVKKMSSRNMPKVIVAEGDNIEMIDETVDYEDPLGLEEVVRLSRVDSNFGDVASKIIIPSTLDVKTLGSKFDAYDYFVKRRGKEATEVEAASFKKKAAKNSKNKKEIDSKKPVALKTAKQKIVPSRKNCITENHAIWLDQRVQKSQHLGDTFRLGALVVHDLGKIAPLGFFGFHTNDRIFPLGYRATRIFWSCVTPNIRCVYVCEVLDGAVFEQEEEQEKATRTGRTINQRRLRDVDHYAIFRITPLDAPMNKFIGLSPAAAVYALRKAVEKTQKLKTRSEGGSFSPRRYWLSYGLGDDGCGFFGFAAPPIRARIEAMPRTATTAITIKLSDQESAVHASFRKNRYDTEPPIDVLITKASVRGSKFAKGKSSNKFSASKPKSSNMKPQTYKPSKKRGSIALSHTNGVMDPSRPSKKHAKIVANTSQSTVAPQLSISTETIINPTSTIPGVVLEQAVNGTPLVAARQHTGTLEINSISAPVAEQSPFVSEQVSRVATLQALTHQQATAASSAVSQGRAPHLMNAHHAALHAAQTMQQPMYAPATSQSLMITQAAVNSLNQQPISGQTNPVPVAPMPQIVQLAATAPENTTTSRKDAPPTPNFVMGNKLFPVEPASQVPETQTSSTFAQLAPAPAPQLQIDTALQRLQQLQLMKQIAMQQPLQEQIAAQGEQQTQPAPEEESFLSMLLLKTPAQDRPITLVEQQRRSEPPPQPPKYKFCYVQPTQSDMLSAQRELALRDAAVRPNPSGCARLEARNIDDAYDRARVTRSLVRAARNLQSSDADGKNKTKKSDQKKTESLFEKGRQGAIRENREKYKRMKALPMAARLEVRRSHIHGWGLFLKRDIRKDEFIVEYVGQIVRQPVGDKREAYYEAAGYGSCYLFRLDQYRIVDATRRGNVGRFINHCCKPNAYARVVNVTKSQKHIVIIALHDLRAGDEVMYDYKFPIEDEKVPCYCGAPNCKGVMN